MLVGFSSSLVELWWLLHLKTRRKRFCEFLKGRYCVENYLVWEHVNQLVFFIRERTLNSFEVGLCLECWYV